MDEFVRIAEMSELREGKGIVRLLDGEGIAIVKLGATVSAFVNSCPHQHTQLVDRYGGQIAGANLTCPMHGWTFHLGTGKCVSGSGRLKMFDVRIEGGGVFVKKIVKDQSLKESSDW